MRAVAFVALVLLLAGCTTQAAIDDALRAIGRSSETMSSGIAAVATRTSELLVTSREQIAVSASATVALETEATALVAALREGVAASASSMKATTASVASTTSDLEAILAETRPNLVASSASVAAILSDMEAGSARLREKSEQPLPRSIFVFVWLTAACLLVLLLHAVWSHLHLSRTVKGLRKELVDIVSQ